MNVENSMKGNCYTIMKNKGGALSIIDEKRYKEMIVQA